jgi:hypothetical protein
VNKDESVHVHAARALGSFLAREKTEKTKPLFEVPDGMPVIPGIASV